MKKFILSITIFLVLLVASAIFLPYLFKDKIIELAKSQANEQLTAQLNFDNNISINIFRSFPDLYLGFNNVSLVDTSQGFSSDTIAQIQKMAVSLDLIRFYKNQEYHVKKLQFIKPEVKLEVNAEGKNNWDIIKLNSNSTQNSNFEMELRKVAIEDGSFSYLDIPGKTQTNLEEINHQSDGSYNSSILNLNTKTSSKNFEVIYNGISYVNRWDISQDGPLTIDLDKSNYEFAENKLTINGLPVSFDGVMQINEEDIDFDFGAQSTSSKFSEFLTLIPAIYSSDYQDIDAKGAGKFDASFIGKYSETEFPAYNLDLDISDGYFKYPDLQLPAEDVNLDIGIHSKSGDTEKTIVDISKFHFKVNDSPFDGSLNVSDIFGDPFIDATAVGLINLGDLKKLIPWDKTNIAEGSIYSDISIKGRASAIKSSQVDAFESSGSLETTNLIYKTPDMPEMLSVDEAKLELDNQQVDIPIFSGVLGNNDVKFSGKLSNFFAYLLSDETLEGKVKLYSKNLDLNTFLDTTSSIDNASATLIEVPGNVNIALESQIDNFTYSDLNFTDFQGKTSIKNKTINLKEIATSVLGGKLKMDGSYLYDPLNPKATFDVAYSNIKIADLMKKFNIVKAFAPIVEQVDALTTAKLKFSSPLNADMSPKLSEVNLEGSLNLEQIAVNKLQSLDQINSMLGSTHFNVKRINDLLLKININQGKLWVQPFDVFIDSSKLSLEGVSFLDGSIKYNGNLMLPATYIKNQTSVINEITKQFKLKDYTIKPSDFLKIAVDIKGNFTKPLVSLNLKEINETIKQSVKRVVKNEVENRKKEVLKEANSELDKVKKEAESRAKEAQNKLKDDLEKKKQQAQEKIRQEAEERKKQLREEAEKRFKNIFKKQ